MAGGDRDWVYDVYEAWNVGDIGRFVAYFAEDCAYVTSGLFPGIDETYVGPEGMRRFHADRLAAWEHFRLEPLELSEDGGLVSIPLRFHGRGRSSGIEVTLDFHHVAVVGPREVRFLAAGRGRDDALETAAEHGVTPRRVS